MRVYSYYYAPKRVAALDETGETVSLVKGTIYFGIRIQDLLLKNNDFYKECGFLLLEEVTALAPPDQGSISTLIISNTADAQRLAVVEKLTFSLIPVDPNRQLNPYNDRYNTGITYATIVPRITMIEKLQEARFTFISRNREVVYRV